MVWQQVTLSKTWRFYPTEDNEDVNGEELVGYYRGRKDDVGENNSTVYLIEEEKSEEVYSVWDTAVLNSAMQHVQVNQKVKIVYKGEEPSPTRKGKIFHDFAVYVDKPEKKETVPLSEAPPSDSEDEKLAQQREEEIKEMFEDSN